MYRAFLKNIRILIKKYEKFHHIVSFEKYKDLNFKKYEKLHLFSKIIFQTYVDKLYYFKVPV